MRNIQGSNCNSEKSVLSAHVRNSVCHENDANKRESQHGKKGRTLDKNIFFNSMGLEELVAPDVTPQRFLSNTPFEHFLQKYFSRQNSAPSQESQQER